MAIYAEVFRERVIDVVDREDNPIGDATLFIDITDISPRPALRDKYDGAIFTKDDGWDRVRAKRNALLAASDYEVTADQWEGMSAAKRADWVVYRQDLRNLPETFAGDANSVIWPVRSIKIKKAKRN